MDDNLLKQMRSEAEEIFKSSVKAVDPYNAVKRFVRLEGDSLILSVKDQTMAKLGLPG